MDAYSDFLKLLDIAIQRAGNAAKLADAIGVNANLLTRGKNKNRTPNLISIQPVLDYLAANWNESLQKTGEELGAFALPDAQTTGVPSGLHDSENNECRQRIAELEAQVKELESQIHALEIYKHKWEGYLEAMHAQGSGFTASVKKKQTA